MSCSEGDGIKSKGRLGQAGLHEKWSLFQMGVGEGELRKYIRGES